MKILVAVLLLIPSLSLGLTFKDGKQVGESVSLNFGKNSMGWDVSCRVNKGSITQNKDILIFKTSENFCPGGVFNQRAEINTKKLSTKEKASYQFETIFTMESNSSEVFQILSIHDGRDGCNPPMSLHVDSDGSLFLQSAYKFGKGEQCERNINELRNNSNAKILRDGTTYKVNANIDFNGKGEFDIEVFIDGSLDVKGTYKPPKKTKILKKNCQFKSGTLHLECEEKIVKYEISKKFYFKHGVYSKNIFDYVFKSKMRLEKIK